MNDKLDKYLLILLVFLFGVLNIGIVITLVTLMLDFNSLVKEQLIEIVAIILVNVLFNLLLISVYRE